MKTTTRRIIETFPKFENKLNDRHNIFLVQKSLEELNEVEATFLRLA